ncbi:hypothetical protein EG68_06427 [Paragonimus skrjabini miyazakii]|uniref:Pellino n=1 Tax=Paragonimus skrjabini miyazakii TaxID=59628 RepID=A0A8S9YUG3_9TREM|nr:hypothetical protein EG68_06427 [Paragonimus skrjabini miyazakii]
MADPVLYGELAIIGFNGISQLSDRGPRRTSKISLYKRPVANGVCPGPVKRVPGPQDSCAVRSHAVHSVSYTLSRNETVVVEYIPDPTTDMFQIGRSTNSHIDFVVSEPEGPRNGRCRRKSRGSPSRTRPLMDTEDGVGQSTHIESAVSRFACRIHVKRDPPHTARIYAAGFDASNNIVLGELAVKWKSKGQMDGLTTNGIMILRADPERYIHPSCGTDGSVALPQWREVSICGAVYEMRDKRCVPTADNRVDEDNVLRDKTLIDLCGATLFWRSGSGLSETASVDDLRAMIDGLNLARFQCPIMYRTLRLSPVLKTTDITQRSPVDPPRLDVRPLIVLDTDSPPVSPNDSKSEPYVYLNCGHVHGWHTWLAECDNSTMGRTCPLCLQLSSFVPLRMGIESAFYIDRALPTHCFSPCGHMASEATVRYWCSVPLPNTHNFELHARCPFCLTSINPEPVKLHFSGDTDLDTLFQLFTGALAANSSPSRSGSNSIPIPGFDDRLISAE